MKKYLMRDDGDNNINTVLVTADGKKSYPLPKCYEHVNHSPDGFAWGYSGSGPAQVSFAILHDFYGKEMAFKYYQFFKDMVIAKIKGDYDLEDEEIIGSIEFLQEKLKL